MVRIQRGFGFELREQQEQQVHVPVDSRRMVLVAPMWEAFSFLPCSICPCCRAP